MSGNNRQNTELTYGFQAIYYGVPFVSKLKLKISSNFGLLCIKYAKYSATL